MRYHRWLPIAIFAVALSVLRIVSPVQANESDVRATVSKPVTIAISGRAAHASADASARLVVTVTGYEPSTAGPVTTVVSLRCGSDVREIGRFGIFPNKAFSVSDGTKPQRFGFPLPDDPSCRQPETAIIRLEPQTGGGAGASITISDASIE
ncbi:hypothetical protein QA648_34655 (plasmid) [Rhizobium sp. CB3171]|uniref:hypothetical protein n=1 Tax=Rhizobium sp. CB3171 TaxID=3039157 RepID=UPI0024B14376|nr:hypothetical protein [Rhizobium sp. CB3171]WFU07233.1 hypothetical protein QA648_34655 [Rhizobium sp. CB3171]